MDAAYRAFVGGGFPVMFGETAETLQCATETDRSNWLIFKDAIGDALASGAHPGEAIPISIRCTSNTSYSVTYAEALQILRVFKTGTHDN